MNSKQISTDPWYIYTPSLISSLFPCFVFTTVLVLLYIVIILSSAIPQPPVFSMSNIPLLLAFYQMLSPNPHMDKTMHSYLPDFSLAATWLWILSSLSRILIQIAFLQYSLSLLTFSLKPSFHVLQQCSYRKGHKIESKDTSSIIL